MFQKSTSPVPVNAWWRRIRSMEGFCAFSDREIGTYYKWCVSRTRRYRNSCLTIRIAEEGIPTLSRVEENAGELSKKENLRGSISLSLRTV